MASWIDIGHMNLLPQPFIPHLITNVGHIQFNYLASRMCQNYAYGYGTCLQLSKSLTIFLSQCQKPFLTFRNCFFFDVVDVVGEETQNGPNLNPTHGRDVRG